MSKKFLTKEEFINKANKIHKSGLYDYSNSNYIDYNTPLTIFCNKHRVEFKQTPNKHISKGRGCPKCGKEKSNETVRLKKEKYFFNESLKIHNNKYDYSEVNYVNSHTKVIIICPIHGEFYQTPNDHLNNHGCSKCNQSKLEKEVKVFLINSNLKFEEQYKPEWLGKQTLDFYLTEYDIAIECQGLQHFEKVEHFGGKYEFEKILERDKRKNNLCIKNNVKLYYYHNNKKLKFNYLYNEINTFNNTNKIKDYLKI